MGRVELDRVTVSRDGHRVLDAVELVVADHERLAILGPSGSGKTLLLRAVAGVEPIDSGRVRIGGHDVTGLAPRDRDVAMIDQQATLQPHLDVRDNLAFALRLRRVPREEVDRRVMAEARALSLRRLLSRRPRTLAAGERHQVSLGRSLVRRGSVLLLDEPLARIDASRRAGLIRELVQVQEGYGVTLLLATNDQRVAMMLGQRIAVLRGGRVVQVGAPMEIHQRPVDEFVAGFVGSPPMNLLPGRVVRGAAGTEVRTGRLTVPSWAAPVSALAGREVTVGLRPESLALADGSSRFTYPGVVLRREFLGAGVLLEVSHGADGSVRLVTDRPGPAVDEPVRLAVDPAAIHLFEPGGVALVHGI